MVLEHLAGVVSLGSSEEVQTSDFVMRRFHAAAYEQWPVFEFVKKAIRVCLYRRDTHLTVAHFAAYYGKRNGAPDGLNPFLAPKFDDLDVQRLLPALGPDAHGTTIQRAVSRWKKVG